MIRRSSGRTPPFVLIGLIFIILILAYNYWTLSTQNTDLQDDLERLQTEIKINAVKQEQSEKKNAALQDQVHDMDELSSKLRKKIVEEEDSLKNSDNSNKKKDYEITKLKSEQGNLEERVSSITQDLEEKELDINKAAEENTHLVSQVDDAIKAIAEKDSQINDLKRQLEQERSLSGTLQASLDSINQKLTQTFTDLTECQTNIAELQDAAKLHEANVAKAQDELAAVRREQIAAAAAQPPQPAMNMIPNIQYKGPYDGPGQLQPVKRGAVKARDKGLGGMSFHHQPILPRDPPNAPRPRPRYSVADIQREMLQDANNGAQKREAPLEKANYNELKKDENGINPVDNAQRNDPLEQPNIPVPHIPAVGGAQHEVIEVPGAAIGGQPELPQPLVQEQLNPPQPPLNMDSGNLDAAIDEEENVMEEDLNDDQDEEGNEIKEDNKNIKQLSDDTREKEENGALEIPHAQVPDDDLDNNEQINVIERQPQQHYYDHNMDKNIRNLERNHLIK